MAREDLFDFKYDGNTIWVYTGESSADVYYSINNGPSKSTGMRYNEASGNYKSGSGATLTHAEAKSRIRGLLG
jgi:hypothetical protein